jgi:7-carboxy-7-deazaguanine synthase
VKLADLFYSIQGEGKLAGVPSIFVRASGCDLRCSWCDTPYASWRPEGDDLPVEQIIQRVREFPCRHVVLTGGEPMIAPDTANLCQALAAGGYHITIESAGTVFHPVKLDLASISPKLANSTPVHVESGRFAEAHDKQRLNLPAIQQFIDHAPAFQLKFVVTAGPDLNEIHSILDQLRGWRGEDILLMPEGTNPTQLAARARWIVDVCKQEGWRYCPRLHVELWGNQRAR